MEARRLVGGDLAAEARLIDPEFYLEPERFSAYARLREEAPVFWYEPAQCWVLSKHADIAWAELQGAPPLTTRQGLNIVEGMRPDLIAARDPGGGQQSGLGFMSDPPQHTLFRRLVTGAFAPGRLSDLEPAIQTLADDLLDALAENEPVDFVEAVATPIAIGVIAQFLGLPPERWGDMKRWTDAQSGMIGRAMAAGSPEAEQAVRDLTEMHTTLAEQLAERAKAPREDFMSTVASIEVDGEPLSDLAQIHAALSVLTAGNDTTRNLLAGAMVTFVEHPDQWEKLVADPSLVPSATEELLRWLGPVTHFGRRATETLVIRDQSIAAGEFVMMLYEAGNRDEAVWPDGELFDVSRGIRNPHLSLGMGIHRCVGAALARLEIRLILAGLVERFHSWELAEPPERIPSTLVQTYRRVPVILTRR